MRSKDQILLENLYENVFLNRRKTKISDVDQTAIQNLATSLKNILKSNPDDDPTVVYKLKNNNTDEVDVSELEGERLESFLLHILKNPRSIINVNVNNSIIPYLLVNHATSIYGNRLEYVIEKGRNNIKCTRSEYVELCVKDHVDDDANAELYLQYIQGRNLDLDMYDNLGRYNELAIKNKDVNVLTIMNQILYPIKDMDMNYFNSIYEKIFDGMAVSDNSIVYLNTQETRGTFPVLSKYFDKGYQTFKGHLNILAQMVVNQFGDDENLKGDDGKMKYSSLLTLAAFAYQ